MKARTNHGRGGGIAGRWLGIMAVGAVGLVPAGAGGWTHRGNATIEDKLGVGTEHPERGFHLQSHAGIFRIDRDADPSAFMLVRTAEGNFNTIHKAYLFGVKGAGVDDGEFTIRDMGATVSGSGGAKRMTIADDGRVSFGDIDAPLAGLHIRNPVGGDIFRLDTTNGTERFSVEGDGDVYANGADLELRIASISSGGYHLQDVSTLLANTTEGDGEESFLALNGQTVILCSSGDDALLRILDESDGYATNFVFDYNAFYLRHAGGDVSIRATKQGNAQELVLATSGEEIQFISDSDNDTAQASAFTWFCDGDSTAARLMDLSSVTGNLRIHGTLTQNHAFDLAEAYWKGEAEIGAGDVVCFDPGEPNAVVLARKAGDRTVVGVVSTDPGLVMGGSAFSEENLEELWGEEIAARFAAQRTALGKELAAGDSNLQGRMAKVAQLKTARDRKGIRKEQAGRLEKEYEHEKEQLADAIEGAVLEAFCRKHLAQVALAGRVPVKVDASYGAIRAGDLLVASATPGRAMRADQPATGTVIGKAMEALEAGQGTIMMMVLNR